MRILSEADAKRFLNDLVDFISDDPLAPQTPEEVDETLIETGYDPAEVGARIGRAVRAALRTRE